MRGMMIRLIDVVLNILFGFIAISDIQMKRQIRLPGASQEIRSQTQEEHLFLQVKIDPAGGFDVMLEDESLLRTSSLDVLSTTLVQYVHRYRAEGRKAILIIDPDPRATVQRTIDVFDICEKEGLPKSINMQVSANPPGD